MYFGNRHTAVLEATMFRTFTCVHCGYESVAKVRTKGEGQGTSPYMLREEGAKHAASEEAHAKAAENADVLASIATCPACDRHDEAKVSSLKTWAYTKGGLFAVGLFALCSMLTGSRHGEMMVFIGIVGGVIALFATVIGDAWKWNEVGERVEVLDHDALEDLIEKVGRAA